MKRCRKCRRRKDPQQFYKHRAVCKTCHRKYGAEWRLANYEQMTASKKAWQAKNKAKHRMHNAAYRRRKYGLTLEDFDKLLAAQKGLCKICQQPMKPAAVDHCHSTGRVRGLLCRKCNVGLGMFRDNPSLLRSAARYLGKARRLIEQ